MNAPEADAAIQARLDAEPDEIPAEAPAAETAAPTTEAPPPVETAAAPDQSAQPEPPSVESRGSEPVQDRKDYEDWLTKFGGPTRDPNVAARATWDMNNRLAAQAKQETPAPPAPAKTEPTAVPQELERFDTDLRAYETKYQKILKQEEQYQAAHDSLETTILEKSEEINAITRDLAFNRVEIEEEHAVRKQLAALVKERDGLSRKRDNYGAWLEKFQSDKAGIDRDWRISKALRDQQEVLLSYRARETEAQEAARQAKLQNFGNTFHSTVQSVAKEGTPGKDSLPDDEVADFRQFAQDKALVYLTPEGQNLYEADIPAFIRKVKGEYLAFVDKAHRRRSTAYAKAKTADASVNAPDGKAAVATETKRLGFASKSEVDAAINAALG